MNRKKGQVHNFTRNLFGARTIIVASLIVLLAFISARFQRRARPYSRAIPRYGVWCGVTSLMVPAARRLMRPSVFDIGGNGWVTTNSRLIPPHGQRARGRWLAGYKALKETFTGPDAELATTLRRDCSPE